MAYNPFDEVIENDPAYKMQIGGAAGLAESRVPNYQQKADEAARRNAELIGGLMAPVYQALTPEKELLEQKEQREQLNQKLLDDARPEIIQLSLLPQNSLEQIRALKTLEDKLVSQGYKGASLPEVFGSIGQAFYGDARAGFENLRDGKSVTDEQKFAMGIAPIDMLDVILAPAAILKLGKLGFKTVPDILKSTSQDPDVIKVKETLGGGDTMQRVESTIMRSPADEGAGGGAGKFGTFTDADRAASKAAFNRNTYEPYRNAYNKFIEGKDSASVSEFRKFLEKENVAPTVASGLKDTKKARDNFNQHLNNALKYLSEGTDVKVRSAAFKPWMTEAEKILRENPDGIYPSAISKLLKDKGFVVDGNRIRAWSKGENVEDKSVLNNLKSGSLKQQIQDEKVIEVKKILDELEKNPDIRGQGSKKYKFTTPGDGKTYTIESVLVKKASGIQKVLGDDVVNKLREYTFKANAPKELFYEYIPAYSKKIFKDSDSVKYNRALDNVFQSFRSGMLGKYNNFEEGMEAYGIQKKTGNKAEDLIINEENKQKILNLNADINKYRRLGGAEKKQYEKIFDDSVELSSYTIPKWKETVLNNPQLRDQVLASWRTIDPNGTLDEAIKAAGKGFSGHVSHIARISGFAGADKEFEKGLRGMGALGSMVRVNFGIENLALQRTAENIVDEGVKIMSRLLKKQKTTNLSDKEQDTLFRIASNIGYYNNLMKTKGMAAYLRIPKETLTDDVMNYLNNYFKTRGGPNLTPSDQVVAKTIKPSKEDNIAEKYNDIFIGTETPQTLDQQKARFDELLDFYVNNPKEFSFSKQSPKFSQDIVEGFGETPYIRFAYPNTAKPIIERETNFKKGGVSMIKGGMAIGGQNFTENMNQQQFTPDPGIEGMSAFEQAVQSGNLQAVNLPKIFQSLGKTLGVFTPNKAKVKTDVPTGTTALVGDEALSSFDFPFVSFTLDKIQKSQTKAAKPQDWINELQGGKDKAPSAELLDSGLFQYLADFEKYYPNQKIPKEKLIETYESNPITNLQVKIKGADTGDAALDSYMGKPRHQNTGSARIDNAGQDYREVVLEAGPLPGEKNPFVNSSHFSEKNVIGFSRVATYKNSQGDNVAVIQELQTDLLTKIRNEQERLDAQIEVLTRRKNKAEETLANPQSDNYDKSTAQDSLNLINNELPKLLELKKSNLIRPYPNVAAEELIPGLNKKLQDIQKNINTLSMQGARRENPEFLMMISRLEDEQKMVLNQLLDLNRSSNYQLAAQGVKVPDLRDRDELLNYIQGNNRYPNMKDIETFPPTPFNKQGDYVDLIIKATIKDAENRGINKIAIIPADIGPNTRWGKDSEEAKKKFRNLYDKVAVQQLNNIAKKYGGSVQVEQIVDSGRGELGLRFLNKGVDGEFQVLKETDIDPSVTIRREDLGPTKPPEGLNAFLNEEILRVAKDYGPNEVVFRREIAPGQTMEYFVNVRSGDVVDQKFDLVPLGDADSARDATIIIEEYNPQLVDMVTLTLPDSNKGKPMFLFKKKKGGIMPDDRLVSITDIYGDY